MNEYSFEQKERVMVPTADDWFAVLKRLVCIAKLEPKLAESDAWRGTYAYAHSRFSSAFEVHL